MDLRRCVPRHADHSYFAKQTQYEVVNAFVGTKLPQFWTNPFVPERHKLFLMMCWIKMFVPSDQYFGTLSEAMVSNLGRNGSLLRCDHKFRVAESWFILGTAILQPSVRAYLTDNAIVWQPPPKVDLHSLADALLLQDLIFQYDLSKRGGDFDCWVATSHDRGRPTICPFVFSSAFSRDGKDANDNVFLSPHLHDCIADQLRRFSLDLVGLILQYLVNTSNCVAECIMNNPWYAPIDPIAPDLATIRGVASPRDPHAAIQDIATRRDPPRCCFQ